MLSDAIIAKASKQELQLTRFTRTLFHEASMRHRLYPDLNFPGLPI